MKAKKKHLKALRRILKTHKVHGTRACDRFREIVKTCTPADLDNIYWVSYDSKPITTEMHTVFPEDAKGVIHWLGVLLVQNDLLNPPMLDQHDQWWVKQDFLLDLDPGYDNVPWYWPRKLLLWGILELDKRSQK